ncbi:MAG: baseplate J/gp47 family protein, partial [Enterobacteriaceae bacterium]
MPYNRKPLTDLRSDVRSELQSRLPAAGGLLRFSNLAVIGDILAGLTHQQLGYLDWIAQQSVPVTATAEYLESWAALIGVYRKYASAATGKVLFTGENESPVPAGTRLNRPDGYRYVTTTEAVIRDGSAVVEVMAVLPDVLEDVSGGGRSGNTDAGIILTMDSALPGVKSQAVSGGLTGGADIESDQSLRSRMLHAYQAPPQGGNMEDVRRWVLEVPGVTRAWVRPWLMGPGSVGIYIMCDKDGMTGFPTGKDGVSTMEPWGAGKATGDQGRVANALYPRQPVTSLVYVASPIPKPIDFEFDSISSGRDMTAEITQAIAT